MKEHFVELFTPHLIYQLWYDTGRSNVLYCLLDFGGPLPNHDSLSSETKVSVLNSPKSWTLSTWGVTLETTTAPLSSKQRPLSSKQPILSSVRPTFRVSVVSVLCLSYSLSSSVYLDMFPVRTLWTFLLRDSLGHCYHSCHFKGKCFFFLGLSVRPLDTHTLTHTRTYTHEYKSHFSVVNVYKSFRKTRVCNRWQET